MRVRVLFRRRRCARGQLRDRRRSLFPEASEDRGTVFKDGGTGKPGLEIFKDHGYTWIRLRLFHTPTQLPNSLPYTIALAKAAHRLGYRFLLDYHYSDTWADPGKQYLPKAWAGLSHEQLVEAVRDYTTQTTIAFREAGVLPDMVQLGNEISNGMLWPDGKLPANWDRLAGAPTTLAGIWVTLNPNSFTESPNPSLSIQQTPFCYIGNPPTPSGSTPDCLITAITVQMSMNVGLAIARTPPPAPITVPLSVLVVSENGNSSKAFAIIPISDKLHILSDCDNYLIGFIQECWLRQPV